MDSTLLIAAGVVGVLVGFALGWLFMHGQFAARQALWQAETARGQELAGRLTAAEQRCSELTATAAAEQAQANSLAAQRDQAQQELREKGATLAQASEDRARLAAEKRGLEQRLEEERRQLLALQEQMRKDFEQLAQQILERKSQTFAEQNKASLDAVLAPLKSNLELFVTRINEIDHHQTRAHSDLLGQIQSLTQLNQQVTAETSSLTRALKGEVKTQGNWGEMILGKILEQSGLEKGVNYTLQESFTGADGDIYRPDAVIRLPGDRDIVIDSKVSLKAFDELVRAASEEARLAALKALVASFRAHANGLADKDYSRLPGLNSPECVLMFVPIEASLSAATSYDPNLYADLFNKKVILVSPAAMMATLRTVAHVWQQEKLRQNHQAIISQADGILDKVRLVVERFDKAAQSFAGAQKHLEDARTSLVGQDSLQSRAEKLQELGVSPAKALSGSRKGGRRKPAAGESEAWPEGAPGGEAAEDESLPSLETAAAGS